MRDKVRIYLEDLVAERALVKKVWRNLVPVVNEWVRVADEAIKCLMEILNDNDWTKLTKGRMREVDKYIVKMNKLVDEMYVKKGETNWVMNM